MPKTKSKTSPPGASASSVRELPYNQLTGEEQATVCMWYALGLNVQWQNGNAWITEQNDARARKAIINSLRNGSLGSFTHRLKPDDQHP